jgi:hypothetical protein
MTMETELIISANVANLLIFMSWLDFEKKGLEQNLYIKKIAIFNF